jgi:hypothetical protein
MDCCHELLIANSINGSHSSQSLYAGPTYDRSISETTLLIRSTVCLGVVCAGHFVIDAQLSAQLFPELAIKLHPTVCDDLLGHAMQPDDILFEEFCELNGSQPSFCARR